MDQVEIYTDGACSGNPGPGGWAALLISGPHVKELAGFDPATTNNRMELTAVIKALEALRRPCAVTIYSDSSYLVNAFQEGWLDNWKRNGWRRGKSKQQLVPNAELWQQLDALISRHQVHWQKVRGHAGHPYNERVDALATEQIERARGKSSLR